jgi:hypothetical protein
LNIMKSKDPIEPRDVESFKYTRKRFEMRFLGLFGP